MKSIQTYMFYRISATSKGLKASESYLSAHPLQQIKINFHFISLFILHSIKCYVHLVAVLLCSRISFIGFPEQSFFVTNVKHWAVLCFYCCCCCSSHDWLTFKKNKSGKNLWCPFNWVFSSSFSARYHSLLPISSFSSSSSLFFVIFLIEKRCAMQKWRFKAICSSNLRRK
jgi:hypothetical protein